MSFIVAAGTRQNISWEERRENLFFYTGKEILDSWRMFLITKFTTAHWSNPIIVVDAKEWAAIMKSFIILSHLVPELERDDCWFFVFQSSFDSQRWKLGGKYAKNACISFNATCSKFLRKFKNHIKNIYIITKVF